MGEMSGLIKLPSEQPPNHCLATDGEMLAFLLDKLQPEILAAVRQGIGERLTALDVCLTQLEQVVAASPEFQSKATIAREVTVLRTLCDRIQKDLSRI